MHVDCGLWIVGWLAGLSFKKLAGTNCGTEKTWFAVFAGKKERWQRAVQQSVLHDVDKNAFKLSSVSGLLFGEAE